MKEMILIAWDLVMTSDLCLCCWVDEFFVALYLLEQQRPVLPLYSCILTHISHLQLPPSQIQVQHQLHISTIATLRLYSPS